MPQCVMCQVDEKTLIDNAKRKDRSRRTKRKRPVRLWDILDSMFHVNHPKARELYKLCHRCCNKLRRCGQKCGNQFHKECRKGNLKEACEENLRTVLSRLPKGSYAVAPHFFKVNDSIPACREARLAVTSATTAPGSCTVSVSRAPRSRRSRVRQRSWDASQVGCVSPRSTDEDVSADEQWRVKAEVDVAVTHHVAERPVRRRRVAAESDLVSVSRGVYVDYSGTVVRTASASDVEATSTSFDLADAALAGSDAGAASSPISTNVGDPLDVMDDSLYLGDALACFNRDEVSHGSMVVGGPADAKCLDTLPLPMEELDGTWLFEPAELEAFMEFDSVFDFC